MQLTSPHGFHSSPSARHAKPTASHSPVKRQLFAKPLYVGNLKSDVPQPLLLELFSSLGAVKECKIMTKDGERADYAIVTFEEERFAELAMRALHGRVLHGLELRVAWKNERRENPKPGMYVGDLSSEVDDFAIRQAFETSSGYCGAEVMWDHRTGFHKKFGFVFFRTVKDAAAAIRDFYGKSIFGRNIKCSWAAYNALAKFYKPFGIDLFERFLKEQQERKESKNAIQASSRYRAAA